MIKVLTKMIKIFQIILFLALIPASFVMISSQTGLIANIRSLMVLSGSMEPKIPIGSIVFVRKDWPYKTGDAIAFKNSEDLTITHRVIEKLSLSGTIFYRVKGDANNIADSELIPENAIIGKEIYTLPYLGKFISYFKTPPGFLAFIILPSAIFIALELRNIHKEIVKETEKRILAKIQLASQGETLQG